MDKKAIIVGAGPAGLAAASELLERTEIKPVLIEENDFVGGISATMNYKNNKIDMGGHRFFTKSERVNDWWLSFLPLQGKASKDDILLGRKVELSTQEGAPAPEETDRVMLKRNRVSRIFYLKTFFDYPVSLNFNTIKGLGIFRMAKITLSYFKALLLPMKDEKSLEDFLINRFGRELYLTFFKDYTEKLWGMECSEISAEWGAQRIKGISILKVLAQIFKTIFKRKGGKVETSFIDSFMYPKFGPGHLWSEVAQSVVARGGEIRLGKRVSELIMEDGRVKAVAVEDYLGHREIVEGDIFISTMPVKDLIKAMGNTVPENVRTAADGLMYRDFRVAGVLLDKLLLKNNTKIKTLNGLVPDTWIYIQEKNVKLGRIQIFNNWSPYLVAEFPDKVWIGLEYFCSEEDELWKMSDEAFIAQALGEGCKIGIFKAEDVKDACTFKVKKAYPAYFGTYGRFDEIRDYTDKIENLYLVGRNGMHRYNNMDHSVLTAMVAVDNIVNRSRSRENIWNVNTEAEYHEEKQE